jgi:hypothetical protein
LIDQHHKLVDSINTWVDGISDETNPSKGKAFFDDLATRIACDYYYLPNLGNAEIEDNEYEEAFKIKIFSREDLESALTESLADTETNTSERYCAYSFKPAEDIDVGKKEGIEKLVHIYDHWYHIQQSELSH